MTKNVLPWLDGLDRPFAEAVSEVAFHPDDFGLKLLPDAIAGPDNAFPPEPSRIVGTVSAYVEGQEGVRSQAFVNSVVSRHTSEEVGEALIHGYQIVTDYHDMMPDLANSMQIFDFHGAAHNIAANGDLKTVASYVVSEGTESGDLYSGLYVPHRILTELPLQYRHVMMQLNALADQIGVPNLADIAKQQDAEEPYKGVLQNDPRIGVIGVMAAAAYLPHVDHLKQWLANSVTKTPTPQSLNTEDARAAALRAKAARKPKKR